MSGVLAGQADHEKQLLRRGQWGAGGRSSGRPLPWARGSGARRCRRRCCSLGKAETQVGGASGCSPRRGRGSACPGLQPLSGGPWPAHPTPLPPALEEQPPCDSPRDQGSTSGLEACFLIPHSGALGPAGIQGGGTLPTACLPAGLTAPRLTLGSRPPLTEVGSSPERAPADPSGPSLSRRRTPA